MILRPHILALDIGTSSVRALLFDAQGAMVPGVLAQRTYKLTTSHEGEVTVDADALFELVCQVISEALQAAGQRATQISGVAMSAFWHSLLGVDAAGRPVMPVMTWEDTRPFAAAQELRTQFDEKAIHDRTGARFHASYWPAKLRWLATNQSDTFQRVTQWISFGEYIHHRLLGKAICSLSMASGTGLLSTRSCAWDSDLMTALGLNPQHMPSLGDINQSVYGLKPEFAAGWPDLRYVPWFPAIGDGAAACVGSGCVSKECWSLTIGTSSAMRVVIPPEQVIPPMGLWLYLIDARRGVLGGALSEGGNLLFWLASTLKLPELREAGSLVSALPPNGHGLTILPFLAGERSLGWHAEARMTISGLSIHTRPAELLRAGMESLAYQLGGLYEQLRQALPAVSAPQIVGSGGTLLNSAPLQQIIADTLGTSIFPSRDQEASARGAALLVLESLGIIPDVSQLKPNLEPGIVPDAKRNAVYQKAMMRQRELYRVLLGE